MDNLSDILNDAQVAAELVNELSKHFPKVQKVVSELKAEGVVDYFASPQLSLILNVKETAEFYNACREKGYGVRASISGAAAGMVVNHTLNTMSYPLIIKGLEIIGIGTGEIATGIGFCVGGATMLVGASSVGLGLVSKFTSSALGRRAALLHGYLQDEHHKLKDTKNVIGFMFKRKTPNHFRFTGYHSLDPNFKVFVNNKEYLQEVNNIFPSTGDNVKTYHDFMMEIDPIYSKEMDRLLQHLHKANASTSSEKEVEQHVKTVTEQIRQKKTNPKYQSRVSHLKKAYETPVQKVKDIIQNSVHTWKGEKTMAADLEQQWDHLTRNLVLPAFILSHHQVYTNLLMKDSNFLEQKKHVYVHHDKNVEMMKAITENGMNVNRRVLSHFVETMVDKAYSKTDEKERDTYLTGLESFLQHVSRQAEAFPSLQVLCQNAIFEKRDMLGEPIHSAEGKLDSSLLSFNSIKDNSHFEQMQHLVYACPSLREELESIKEQMSREKEEKRQQSLITSGLAGMKALAQITGCEAISHVATVCEAGMMLKSGIETLAAASTNGTCFLNVFGGAGMLFTAGAMLLEIGNKNKGSLEEVILLEVRHLSIQIAQLREEIHHRFDALESNIKGKLDLMFDVLCERLDSMNERMNECFAGLEARLENSFSKIRIDIELNRKCLTKGFEDVLLDSLQKTADKVDDYVSGKVNTAIEAKYFIDINQELFRWATQKAYLSSLNGDVFLSSDDSIQLKQLLSDPHFDTLANLSLLFKHHANPDVKFPHLRVWLMSVQYILKLRQFQNSKSYDQDGKDIDTLIENAAHIISELNRLKKDPAYHYLLATEYCNHIANIYCGMKQVVVSEHGGLTAVFFPELMEEKGTLKQRILTHVVTPPPYEWLKSYVRDIAAPEDSVNQLPLNFQNLSSQLRNMNFQISPVIYLGLKLKLCKMEVGYRSTFKRGAARSHDPGPGGWWYQFFKYDSTATYNLRFYVTVKNTRLPVFDFHYAVGNGMELMFGESHSRSSTDALVAQVNNYRAHYNGQNKDAFLLQNWNTGMAPNSVTFNGAHQNTLELALLPLIESYILNVINYESLKCFHYDPKALVTKREETKIASHALAKLFSEFCVFDHKLRHISSLFGNPVDINQLHRCIPGIMSYNGLQQLLLDCEQKNPTDWFKLSFIHNKKNMISGALHDYFQESKLWIYKMSVQTIINRIEQVL